MNFEALFTVNFLVFCLAIAGITEICNRLIIFFILDNPKFTTTRTSKFWKNVISPSIPVLIGILIALFSGDYAFPKETSMFNGRIMLAIVGGLVSHLALQAVYSFFSKYTGINISPTNENPVNKTEDKV